MGDGSDSVSDSSWKPIRGFGSTFWLVPSFDFSSESLFQNLEPARTGPRTRMESPTQVDTGHILVQGWYYYLRSYLRGWCWVLSYQCIDHTIYHTQTCIPDQHPYSSVLILSILWCSQGANHPYAKYEMEENEHPSIFLTTYLKHV